MSFDPAYVGPNFVRGDFYGPEYPANYFGPNFLGNYALDSNYPNNFGRDYLRQDYLRNNYPGLYNNDFMLNSAGADYYGARLPGYDAEFGYGSNTGYGEQGFRSMHQGYVTPCAGPYGAPGYYNYFRQLF